MWMRSGLLFLLLLLHNVVYSAVPTYGFASPELAQRFADLTRELRCPKCPNQSLSDSDAIISTNLRRHVQTMLDQGYSDNEIRAFMAQRYGDFILYDPPLKASTLVLWFAPAILSVSMNKITIYAWPLVIP